MRIYDFFETSPEPMIVLLGRFDGLHTGHQSLISEAKRLKKENACFSCASIALFTFVKTEFSPKQSAILSFDETLQKAEKLGVDCVITGRLSPSFYNFSAGEFTYNLLNSFNVYAVICGEDYTYGKGKSGNAKTLQLACDAKKIPCKVVETIERYGEKVSSTGIKRLLLSGDIRLANELLGEDYFVSGVVERGRGVGASLGFATANITLSDEKFLIKEGVYKTQTLVDGKLYDSVTNYGGAPTFDSDKFLVETHILGEVSELYGKKITVYFKDFLRETVKFDDEDQLKKQIEKDLLQL